MTERKAFLQGSIRAIELPLGLGHVGTRDARRIRQRVQSKQRRVTYAMACKFAIRRTREKA
jgi:hypothetical protein